MQILENRKELYNYITTHIHGTSEWKDGKGQILLCTGLYEWADGSIHDEPEGVDVDLSELEEPSFFEESVVLMREPFEPNYQLVQETVDKRYMKKEPPLNIANPLEALGWTSDCE